MKTYIAHYVIDGGESDGFGLKRPVQYKKDVSFKAKDDSRAYRFSLFKALALTNGRLSNPDTKEIRVTLSGLEVDGCKVDIGEKTKTVSVDSLSNFLGLTHPRYENGGLLKVFRRKLRRKLAA